MVPRLNDASGAFASRFILLVLTESFLGREDHGLFDKLIAELPGILNWSIEGWRRLNERGYFVQPHSARELVEQLEALSSPIRSFAADRCEIRAGNSVPVDDLFKAWQTWSNAQGRGHPGTKQTFGRDLKAAFPGITTPQPRSPDGKRYRAYEG